MGEAVKVLGIWRAFSVDVSGDRRAEEEQRTWISNADLDTLACPAGEREGLWQERSSTCVYTRTRDSEVDVWTAYLTADILGRTVHVKWSEVKSESTLNEREPH